MKNVQLYKNIANIVLFQVGWWLCVLGGNSIALLYTSTFLLIHFYYFVTDYRELWLILLLALVGVAIDTALIKQGLMSSPSGMPEIWMICLWPLFASTLMHSLKWLAKKPMLAAACGSVAGPASYWAGISFSEVSWSMSPLFALLVLALIWMLLLPSIFLLVDEKN